MYWGGNQVAAEVGILRGDGTYELGFGRSRFLYLDLPHGGFPTSQSSAVTPQKRTYPANLCLFWGRVEFPGRGEDLDEAVGKATEKAARGVLGMAAAEHLQNLLGGL